MNAMPVKEVVLSGNEYLSLLIKYRPCKGYYPVIVVDGDTYNRISRNSHDKSYR